MKILIINAGSSSLKYQFMESEGGRHVMGFVPGNDIVF